MWRWLSSCQEGACLSREDVWCILGGCPSDPKAVGTAYSRETLVPGRWETISSRAQGLLQISMRIALTTDAEKWKLWPVVPSMILLKHHHTSETILRGLGNLSHPLHPHTSAYKYIMYGSFVTVWGSPKGTAKSFRRPQRNHPALQHVCFPYS